MTRSVDAELARRLELASAWRAVRYARAVACLWPEQAVAVEAVAGGYAVWTGPAFPVNRAIGLGLSVPVAEEHLDQVEAFYRSRSAVPAVDLCPLAHESLLDALHRRGYRLEHFFSVLWRPLPLGDGEILEAPGVRVTRPGPDDAELWLRTVAEGFDGEPEPSPALKNILAANFYAETAVPLLAWVDGQPAGGGSLVSYGRVAELCSAATRPAFRRRGVQRALLGARLQEAGRAGNDLAMAITTPGTASQRNAERVGFRLAYTKAVLGLDDLTLVE